MGYGIKDVQEALAAEEPSAIKDAYLIVRENKLMQANRKFTLLWSRTHHLQIIDETVTRSRLHTNENNSQPCG
jgi:hypothetical protein